MAKIIDQVIAESKKAIEKQDGELTDDVKESIERLLVPILQEGLKPIVKELEDLRFYTETIHNSLPGAFSSVGAGPSAAGPVGAATYSSSTANVSKITAQKKKLTSIKNKL